VQGGAAPVVYIWDPLISWKLLELESQNFSLPYTAIILVSTVDHVTSIY